MTSDEQQQTFDLWINQHDKMLFKVVHAFSRNHHEHEDLFQDISLNIWNAIPKFTGKSSVKTYLYRIAFYTASTWVRGEIKQRKGKDALIKESPVLQCAPQSPNPRLEWLYEQIAQYNEVDRSLTLLLLDGFQYREIAEILGLSESNVGVKINRIKKRLIKLSNRMDIE